MDSCCDPKEKDACTVVNQYQYFCSCCCNGHGQGNGPDGFGEKLKELEEKIKELEEKIENCDCCDCGENPGNEVSIRLSESHKELSIGSGFQLQAIVGPADLQDKSVTWSTSDPSIATVDQDGNVTAIGVGTVTITASTNVGGKSASCSIDVTEAPSIQIDFDVLLPFRNSYDENLGSDTPSIVMGSGSIACDVNDGGYFNGSSRVLIQNYNFGDEWTMGCWAKLEDMSKEAMLFVGRIAGERYVGFQLYGLGKSCIYCNSVVAYRDIPTLEANRWYHFTINSNAQLYIDGTYVVSGTKGNSLAGTPVNLGIGNVNDASYNRYAKGYISNFFIVKKMLTPADLLALYQLGQTPYTR